MAVSLYNGDCLDIMPTIPDKSIDMILCDLPYGTTACKWDIVIPFDPMWKELKRIIKNKGAIALFGSEPFSSYLRLSNIDMYKYDWIWNKKAGGNIMTCSYQPFKIHEIISIFSDSPTSFNKAKNNMNYYPIMEKRDKIEIGKIYSKSQIVGWQKENYKKEYTHKYPKSILTYSFRNQKIKVAPTQKPTSLLEYLITTYTKENETVFDFTMGSGSTGVACMKIGRKFIGIEKDEKYFQIAKNRIEEERSQGKLFY